MVQPLHVITHASVLVLQIWPAPQVEVPRSQRSAASVHVSVPLHATPSLHTRAMPPTQAAIDEQVSPVVQYSPSSQLAPVSGVHAVLDVAVSHVSHRLEGLMALAAWQTPAMMQPLQVITQALLAVSQICPAGQVGLPASQRSVVSLQLSVPSQVTPSSQLRAAPVPHTASAEQVSPVVQYWPSSQTAPVRAVHAPLELAVLQIWQGLTGLKVPSA